MTSNNYTLAHPGRSHPPGHRSGTAPLRPWARPGIWGSPGGRAVGAEPRVPRENQHLRRRAEPPAPAPGRPPAPADSTCSPPTARPALPRPPSPGQVQPSRLPSSRGYQSGSATSCTMALPHTHPPRHPQGEGCGDCFPGAAEARPAEGWGQPQSPSPEPRTRGVPPPRRFWEELCPAPGSAPIPVAAGPGG